MVDEALDDEPLVDGADVVEFELLLDGDGVDDPLPAEAPPV